MIVRTIRLSVGLKSTPEGVRLLLNFFRLDSLRGNYGETRRHRTRRITLQYSKVGQALNASNSEISKDVLRENIRCIFLVETSGLTSSDSLRLCWSRRVKALGTVGNSLTVRMPSVHDGVICCAGSEIQWPGNVMQWWQQ